MSDVLGLVVEKAGGQTKLAGMLSEEMGLKISPQRVFNWLNRDKKIPAELVLATEKVTGVSRHMIRPDIYPESKI